MERVAMVMRRSFSSPIPGFLHLLTKEISFESERRAVNEQITSFLNRSGYHLTELEDSTKISLEKNTLGSQVTVTFQAMPHLPGDLHGSGKTEQDFSSMHALPFQVTVALPPQGLIFECSATKAEWSIEKVVFARDLANWEKRSNVLTGELYRGPEVKDGPVKEEMVRYLEYYGVNPELVSFMAAYSKDKEQRLYIRWLKETHSFFSPRSAS